MVFATDIDSYDDAKRTDAKRTGVERAGCQPLASQGIRRVPLESYGALSRGTPSHGAQSHVTPSRGTLSHGAGDRKVVPLHMPPRAPLHMGGPATRVQLENKALPLPRKPKLPLGLQILNRFQQGSAVLTGVLIAGALVVYGSTVYVDKSTSRALIQLDELQGESQQLTSASESIKQSLAEQAAREDSGLEPYEADDVILLTPAPLRSGEALPEPEAELPAPLGY